MFEGQCPGSGVFTENGALGVNILWALLHKDLRLVIAYVECVHGPALKIA